MKCFAKWNNVGKSKIAKCQFSKNEVKVENHGNAVSEAAVEFFFKNTVQKIIIILCFMSLQTTDWKWRIQI